MDTFSAVVTCLFVGAILLDLWGVGSLFATIGKVRGWNTKRAFWISALSYGLLLFVVWVFVVLAEQFSINDPAATRLSTLFFGLILLGAFVALGTLIIRLMFPFKKSTSNLSGTVSNASMTPKAEPLPLKTQTFPAETDIPSRPVPIPAPAEPPSQKSSHIFVSYRRSDSADIAGRIYDRLVGKFGRDPVFKDVDSIPLGLDFKEYLDQKVSECDVLLAIIGDRWLEASDSAGNRRLEDPNDFVRIEIQSALERGIPVIPLLVREAHMPRQESLPVSLQKLVYRNGIPIRPDPDFHRDMDRLIAALEKYMQPK